MSPAQLPLIALKISLINVGKIDCMSCEKYKQTIYFSPAVFICFSPVAFFLSDLRTIRLHTAWVYLGGRFGTLFTPGLEYFRVIFSHQLLLQKCHPWMLFSGVINAPL